MDRRHWNLARVVSFGNLLHWAGSQGDFSANLIFFWIIFERKGAGKGATMYWYQDSRAGLPQVCSVPSLLFLSTDVIVRQAACDVMIQQVTTPGFLLPTA